MTQDNEESVPIGVSTQDVHTEEDLSTNGVKKTRGSIRPPAELYDEFIDLKRGGESVNDLLRRLIDNASGVDTLNGRISDLASNNEHLQKQVNDLRGELETDRQLINQQVDEYAERIEERDDQIKVLELELHDKHTAVVSAGGQASLDSFGSLGMKDIAEEIREGCGGDETCTATVLKLQETRVGAMSKHLDREHDTEQKRLDRGHDSEQKELDRKQKELDRESKEKQAEKERDNKLELNLLKKGIVRKSFLEDAAFVNISSVPKRPNKEIENRKRQARAEAEDEDDWSEPTAEEELMMHEDFEEEETDDHAE